ncbi:hypothetical protein H8F21_13930 [Pseudomonas sp. P66]|uniref:Uncharacterized protein n=1 Tax=Pseudomonas arcuscaelestis TaxID=2710591 RepID=A0ABS2BYV7_9PSED|nr:hypothetical protein [Pseudomonas arcuscaelestis]MBM5458665.1 hypothetical protein [Pseudomonas arcuscaelestis]
MNRVKAPALSVVAQCVMTSVVVSASHPTLGPVYWCFTDGTDHNAPSCYTLTTHLESALTLRKGWREGIMAWSLRDHMDKVLADEEQFLESYDLDHSEDGSWATAITLGGMLKVLHERSGQSVEAFAEWLVGAVWLDVEVPDLSLDSPVTFEVPQFKPEAAWPRMRA